VESGVCQDVAIRYARKMHRDDGLYPVLAVLWQDGAITSVAFKDKDTMCEHTEQDGGNEAYWAWVAFLASKGYKEVPLEVE
jgi:hypothetical protein